MDFVQLRYSLVPHLTYRCADSHFGDPLKAREVERKVVLWDNPVLVRSLYKGRDSVAEGGSNDTMSATAYKLRAKGLLNGRVFSLANGNPYNLSDLRP